MSAEVTLTICCITFQHARYIRAALEGFVSQKMKGSLEILIHDDASTDGTQELIRDYAARDGRIRPILRTVNLKSTGVPIFPILFKEARGKYIAMCEGDDHWIDPNKLQRQIDALEKDPSAMGCFTDAYNETEGSRVPYMDHGYATSPKGPVGLNELIRGQGIPTCTFVFRNTDLTRFYDSLKNSPVGDTLLFTHLAGKGHFIYQPERTGVRVIHPGGMYSMRSAIYKLRVHLELLPIIDRLSDHLFCEQIEERNRKALDQAWSEAITTNNRELAKYVWPKIAKERGRYGWNITTTIRNFFKAYWPLPDRIFTKLTGR